MTLVAARDASWRGRPGKARRYHAVERNRALCGLHGLFVMESALPLSQVPPELRCRRVACQKAFKEVDRRVFGPEDKGETHSFPARRFTPTANVYFQRIAAEKMTLPEIEEGEEDDRIQ